MLWKFLWNFLRQLHSNEHFGNLGGRGVGQQMKRKVTVRNCRKFGYTLIARLSCFFETFGRQMYVGNVTSIVSLNPSWHHLGEKLSFFEFFAVQSLYRVPQRDPLFVFHNHLDVWRPSKLHESSSRLMMIDTETKKLKNIVTLRVASDRFY